MSETPKPRHERETFESMRRLLGGVIIPPAPEQNSTQALAEVALAAARRIIALAFEIPAPNAITPQIVMMAQALELAAKRATLADAGREADAPRQVER